MLLSECKTSIIKFYLNSQQISDSFYHITESNELNKKKKNEGPKHTNLDMFSNFCVGLRLDVNIHTVRCTRMTS